MTDIVITGAGAVTPIGGTVETFWRAVLAGRSGLTADTEMDLSGLPCGWVAGVVPRHIHGQVVARWGSPRVSSAVAMLREAVEQAVDDCGLAPPLARRLGYVWLRSSPKSGSTPAEFDLYLRAEAQASAGAEADRADEVFASNQGSDHNSIERALSQRFGAGIVSTRLEATCSGGLRAVAEGARMLQAGMVDAVVVAGCVSRRNPYVFSQYAQLMACSRWKGAPEQASMPFDKRRSGMVISEAASAIVLETEASARARGVHAPYARLGGWALAVDTSHVTAPRSDAVERVMRTALRRSGLDPADIDTINAHGTSTKLNDITEARALHAVFGEHIRKLDVTAIKSMTGHASGASGILETIVAALSLKHGIVPPVPTCTEPDPECDVTTHLEPVARTLNAVMKDSFGFGGQYASMIFTKAEARAA